MQRLLADGGVARRAAELGRRLRQRSGPDEAAALLRGFAADNVPCRRRGGSSACGGSGGERCVGRPWAPFAPPPLCCEGHALWHAAANLAAKAVLLLLAAAAAACLWGRVSVGRAAWVVLAAALSPP
jgi:hypothetical protein